MSPPFVLDTHALFWHLTDPTQLSVAARQVFEDARQGHATLVLSPIVLLELYGVIRKVKAPVDFQAELTHFERSPYRIEPITADDLRLLDQLDTIPELHDRLISATAVRLGAAVVTRDPAIRSCTVVQSVW